MSRIGPFWRIITSALLFSISVKAQTHKGISFQGVIKLPNGEYPTGSGITVNAKILSPNDCVLREEDFAGVNLTNGYINIPIGTGTTGGANPAGLTLRNVMDNSSTFNSLTCLNADGSVNGGVTSFDPSTSNGSRKFRLSLTIDSTPVVADFNMRSMAYAINAESLDGKTKTDFIQTSGTLTQARLEEFISNMTAASGNAIKWNAIAC